MDDFKEWGRKVLFSAVWMGIISVLIARNALIFVYYKARNLEPPVC